MRTKLYTESLIIPGDSAEHKAPAFPRSSSVNDEPDRVLELNRKACEAIWELWQISNKTGTSEKQRAQAELAKQCLKVLESFAHDPGRTKRKPGDSATAQQNRDMLNALSMLADGKSMKEISIELKPQIAHEKAIRYYSVRFKQFSIRLYNAVRLKYPRWGDESLSSLSGTYLTDAVDGWPGLQPTDAKALRKGLEIYFSKHPKLTKQQRLDTD